MTEVQTRNDHGVLTEPTTLKIQRLLPGPIERVWAFLTESDLRRQWLAAGTMEMKLGTPFELVWRNDELTDPPGQRPADFGEEHRMQCRILELQPPVRLVFTWGASADVCFGLEQQGSGEVLLTVTHRRVTDRAVLLNVSAGWHAHLDILSARLGGRAPLPFWDTWRQLHEEYDERMPR